MNEDFCACPSCFWPYFTSLGQSQALVNNPKIEVRDGTYGFKPKYNLKDKKALLRLLDKHDQLGLGGVLLEDVEEGLPNSAKAIKVEHTKYDHIKDTLVSAFSWCWLVIPSLLFIIITCEYSQALGDQIIFVTRPDKKKILFYNDKHCQFVVDEGENKSALSALCVYLQVFFC